MFTRFIPKAFRRYARQNLTQFTLNLLSEHIRRLEETEAYVEQLATVLRHEHGLIPIPPAHLQIRVTGRFSPEFIESGYWHYNNFNELLKPVNRTLNCFSSILDFGSGCGRVIRALAGNLPDTKLFGTDIDPEAIAWCQANYGRFGSFSTCPHEPPTPYSDNSFDFIYGISVFTHLPEDLQFKWLQELRRICKPGGYLILTKHGHKNAPQFPDC